MKPFFIFSLPRSRSAWLSRFLSYGTKRVGHDIAIGCSSLDELFSRIDGLDGTVETGSVLGHRAIRNHYPQSPVIVIRRRLEEVTKSLEAVAMPFDLADLERKNALLDELSQESGVITFRYSDLDTEQAAKAIFETCLRLPFDRNWWLKFRDVNIQMNIPAVIEQLVREQPNLTLLKAEAAAWKSP